MSEDCKHPEDQRILLQRGKIDSIWYCNKCLANFVSIHQHIKDAEPEEDVLGV